MGAGRVGLLLATVVLLACAPGTSSPAPRPPSTSSPTGPASFDAYVGAYQSTSGSTFVVNGHGHILRLRDSWFRQLYTTSGGPGHFSFGPGFGKADPKQGEVTFTPTGARATQLTLTSSGQATVSARRQEFKETEVTVPANGASLAGTITEPLTPGPHPGIVIIHAPAPARASTMASGWASTRHSA